jgi:hypothetical protein
MCHALGSKGGRQKEKDGIEYTVVGNFVFYCICCGFSHALLVFLHTWIHSLANYRPMMLDQ